MRNAKLEKWILLRQSGELGRLRGFLLDRALARDPELRRFATDAARLADASRAWSVAQPGPHTAESIHARLTQAPDRRDEISLLPAPTRRLWPILAGATALLLAVVMLTDRLREPNARQAATPTPTSSNLAWDDGVDAELDALLELVAVTGLEDTARNMDAANDEEQLIRAWLEQEGIAI